MVSSLMLLFASSEMRRQRGVALILVLMVTSVVGLLILSISLAVRSQVTRAQALIDRANLVFQVHSIESELAFAMLTRDLVRDPDREDTLIPAVAWNFIGVPFKYRDATISLQDVGGLFVSPQRAEDAKDFGILFQTLLGFDQSTSISLARRLELKMREPNWVAIQSFRDADFGDLIGKPEQQLLERFAILSPDVRFNPLGVPDVLLPVWFSAGDVEAIRVLRRQGSFDALAYEDLLGSPDEFTVTYPGPQFRVAILAQSGSATQTRSSQWIIDPYGDQPLSVFYRKRSGDEF